MSDSETRLNPYAPVAGRVEGSESVGAEVLEPRIQDSEEAFERRPLWRTAMRWLVVCGISAAPSFVFGMVASGGQAGGMLLGILIFVAGYTWLDDRTAGQRWRQTPRVRRTLRIAYGTRIVISVVFPVGAYLDVICGIVSLALVGPITGHEVGSKPLDFWGTVLTTLVQGLVLNVVLGAYALLVYLAQLLAAKISRSRQAT